MQISEFSFYEFASLYVASVTSSKMNKIFSGDFLTDTQYTVMTS